MSPPRTTGALLLAACLVFVPVALLAQQPGTITGSVTDATSGRPLPSARIVIEGTILTSLSNAEGRFLFLNVSAGAHRLRVTSLGYGPEVRDVVLQAGQTAVADFGLSLTSIALDAVFVTVTGERRKRELGNAVASIEAPEVLEAAPVFSMSELLQGRAAGVQVHSSSGATGMGSRIRIRGSSSISLSNEPLVYVDGVRVESRSTLSVWGGGQSPTRLDDVNPEDIESVEIVKGPAASTLYGTEAANGVIRITTKRGRPGATRWSGWTEVGVVQDRGAYPLNYAGLDQNSGPFGERCFLDFEVRGLCTQTGMRSYQVLADPVLSPIATGSRRQFGLSVTGGSEQVNFYVSAEREREVGPFELPGLYRDTLLARGIAIGSAVEHPQQLERMSVRANLNAQVRPNTTLSVRAGYVSSDLSIMPNDNNSDGLMWNALSGGTDPENPDRAWGARTPAESFGVTTAQSVERFTTAASAQSSPRSWLDLRATAGLDYVSRSDVVFAPRDLLGSTRVELGYKVSNHFNDFRYTLDAGATARRSLTSTIGSETSVGLQFFRTVFEGTLSTGEDIVNGASSIGAAAETLASEVYGEDKTAGVFVEQTFHVRDRLFVTGALRADDHSAFGRDFDLVYYPKLSVSWVASEESFFPDLSFLDEVRLRAAWGRSGLQPNSSAAISTLDAFPTVDGADETVSGVRIGAVGNNLLEPERSSELELGVDAGLLGGRFGVEVTYYDKSTVGALVKVPLAPSLGSATTRWANVGDVVNRGIEASVHATPVATDAVRWEVSLSGSHNYNELLSLGADVERVGEGGANFVPGYPLGGNWALELLGYDDADGNGILTADEVVVSDTLRYTGADMTNELSATSTLTLFGRLRLYALVQYRGGGIMGNGTDWAHCALRKCRALVDRSTPLADQAAAVAAVYHPSRTLNGFLQDGGYTKLREISLTYTVPDDWASRVGASRLSATLAGRNLKTWTAFKGLDPESNYMGQANFGGGEFMTQPPPRYWTLRFNVAF